MRVEDSMGNSSGGNTVSGMEGSKETTSLGLPALTVNATKKLP